MAAIDFEIPPSPQATYPPELYREYTLISLGNALGSMFYGVYMVIALMNLVLLLRKRYKILLVYNAVQMIITTLYVAFSLYQSPFLTLSLFGLFNTEYPRAALETWNSVLAETVFVLNTWLSDGFLIYRCYTIWMGNKYAIAVPTLLYLATIGVSIAYLWAWANPGVVYTTITVQDFGRPYWTCSVALNVFASCLISVRLWLYRRDVIRALGPLQGHFYLSYMAMTLESASLYTVFGIVVLVLFSLGNPVEDIFFPLLGMSQVIAPALIIYRIARGTSFTTDKYTNMARSTVHFATSPHQDNETVGEMSESLGEDTMRFASNSMTDITRKESQLFTHEEKQDP